MGLGSIKYYGYADRLPLTMFLVVVVNPMRFVTNHNEHGQTLAAILRLRLKLTWSEAKNVISNRKVKVAGQTSADPAKRVKSNQAIEIFDAPHSPIQKSKKQPTALRSRVHMDTPPGIIIRHSDDDILVVEKPAGLTTMRHSEEAAEFGTRGKKFLPKTLADFLPTILNDGLPIIPVHRIDKDTSGLVVFARNDRAAKHLGQQFRNHSIERTYLAIVRGQPEDGKIESWIVRDRGDGRRGNGPKDQGQRAITHVRVVRPFGQMSLIECRLETGRTHQIRIHLGEAGCPLAGERIYDRPIHGRPLADPSGAKRVLLHAASLGLVHPAKGKKVRWKSEMPGEMKKTLPV